ncbi:two component transcriptional regulator, LuxR family [Granulicella rosea]|uniref:Two component transcriptional regulator, LuxR family n=1 Tax=Granulicella rosea TaxID=474952 RepID=A0A239EMH0_9BACT|nr:response regulator transcription factor [Granulicella rosea]SNS45601.1 two component transcriptional regulator, LuxR family [Granulicella rosea]
MNRIILADDQAIFRAGAARVLALEDDMRIIAQCEDGGRLPSTVETFRGSLVLFGSGLTGDKDALLKTIASAGSRAIMIAENKEEISPAMAAGLHGLVTRAVSGQDLVDCVRKVARGQRSLQRSNVNEMAAQDHVGARVRDRLTPKEMQIVALIVQGCKNKDIANQLSTKEQVIKNYLRSIYDKTGVSDRLELALFTLHHRILAEAAAKAGTLIQMKTA